MSNLCQEITSSLTLSIILIVRMVRLLCVFYLLLTWVRYVTSLWEENLCDLTVRALEELIDYQEYHYAPAARHTLARRSLGIGFIGLAHYFAKNGVKYDSQEAYDLTHKLTESFQYNLLRASNNIAKEKGACDAFYQAQIHRWNPSNRYI